MPEARYFLPDHPRWREVYSREALRAMLLGGQLRRGEIVLDDETGRAHLLGDLLARPELSLSQAKASPSNSPHAPRPAAPHHEVTDEEEEEEDEEPEMAPIPRYAEFRAETPLPEAAYRVPQFEEEEEEEDDDAVESEEEPEEFSPPEELAEDEEDDEAAIDALLDPGIEWHPGDGEIRMGMDDPYDPQDRRLPLQASPVLMAEEMLYHLHPSWLGYPKRLAAMLILSGAAWYFYHEQWNLAYAVVAGSVAAICMLSISLDRSTTDYCITSRRVELEFGIAGRSSNEIRVQDISAIDVRQTGFAGMLGVGTVEFSSSGGLNAEVRFKDVRNPHRLKRVVRELQG